MDQWLKLRRLFTPLIAETEAGPAELEENEHGPKIDRKRERADEES